MLLAFLDANDLIGQSTCMIGCFKLGSVFFVDASALAIDCGTRRSLPPLHSFLYLAFFPGKAEDVLLEHVQGVNAQENAPTHGGP